MESVDDCAGQGVIDGGRDASGARVVKLVGEIDLANAAALGEKFDRLIGEGEARLVVDLSALEFMDSSGIAILLRAAGRVDSISVRNPTNIVRRIIECTGLAEKLHIES